MQELFDDILEPKVSDITTPARGAAPTVVVSVTPDQLADPHGIAFLAGEPDPARVSIPGCDIPAAPGSRHPHHHGDRRSLHPQRHRLHRERTRRCPDLVGLVNKADSWTPCDRQYPDAPLEDRLPTVTLDLLAPMILTQRVWPILVKRADSVVNTASSGSVGDGPLIPPDDVADEVIRLLRSGHSGEVVTTSRTGQRVSFT